MDARMERSMKQSLSGLALMACASLALGADDQPPTRTLLVIGDSISAAYGIPVEASWVNLLRQRLGPAFEVVNASVSGDTTGGGLARIGKTLAIHDPDFVIIELGGNDGLRGLPIDSIRDNLRSMAEAVIESGGEPILAGMLMPPNLGPRYTAAFQKVYEEVAESTGAALVPFLLEGVAATEEDLMQPDGIHPNAAAQERLMDNVWEVLAPLLQSENTAEPN